MKKRGGAKIWIASAFADPVFVDALADADRLFEHRDCRVIKDQKKIKIGRLSLPIAGKQRSIYVKRYNAFSLRFRLLSPFLRSGALRSVQGADVLRREKIATAQPIAAVERRFCGMLCNSFFVSEEIPGGKTADAYWRESFQEHNERQRFTQRRSFLRSLAGLFHTLHARQIYHNDLKDTNIIVVKSREMGSLQWFLLDLEGIRQYGRLIERRRIKNLVQLDRTLGRYVSKSGRVYFLKCYLGPSFADRKLRRKLIANVLRAARNVEIAKARGHRSK